MVFPSFDSNSPTSINPGIIYATATNPHSLTTYPSNPNTVSSFGPNGLPTTGSVGVQIFPATLPTMRTHHFSLDTEYDLGHNLVATLGYSGSISRDILFSRNQNAAPAASGFPLNPQIGGGDFWNTNGYGNYNSLLAELKHQFANQFMADAQFTWAKSMDTSSGPFFEQDYPYDPGLSYGHYALQHRQVAFKLYGVWQPVFFHGSHSWIEKIAGGWSFCVPFSIFTPGFRIAPFSA